MCIGADMVDIKYFVTIFLIWENYCECGADGLVCLSCSYNRSGNPLVDYYDCILNPSGVSRMPCPQTFQCKTIAIFDKDLTYIMSATRNCLPIANPGCYEDKCCNLAGLYPQCEQKCSESLCNNYDPENWLSLSYEEGNTKLPRIGMKMKKTTATTTQATKQSGDDGPDNDDENPGNDDDTNDDDTNDDDTSGDGSNINRPNVMVKVDKDLFEINSDRSGCGTRFNTIFNLRHVSILISIIILNVGFYT